uniref:carbohydrate-binding family 9-like protein n=1 Tax=uncultured Draconibacterium sp. TaxID=1573823 RepID=UPI003216A698
MKDKLSLVLVLILVTSVCGAQDLWKGFEHLFTQPRNYVVSRVIDKIEIDGINNEKSWKHAKWSEYYNDIEGDKKPVPKYKTRMKMLWDNTTLYIFAELEEPHIWAYYTKNDMIVFHENDFEVFIDPDRDTHDYYEFEVNAQNTLFDLFLDKPYRNGCKANIEWNAKGFVSAVQIDGTLNNPNDLDNKWTVEIAIPFSSLTNNGDYLQPEKGDMWKINFSRVNWQTEIVDGKYVRKVDPETNKRIPEYNWVWSPQGVINMHYPERWGLMQFSGNSVKNEKLTFELPQEEQLAKYLWLIYYKQQSFKKESGYYASTLESLEIQEAGDEESVSYKLELTGGTKTFSAQLLTGDGMVLSINEQGYFKVQN